MIVLAVTVPVGAAGAAPGDAVIYEGNGDPIGADTIYGGVPLAVYTSETNDDDWWGLDANGLPANDDGNFDSIDGGIPIGFEVNFYGVTYDEVYVGSNGTICFINDCSDYDDSVEETFEGSAGFAAMAIDSDPSEESWDGAACDFGGYHQNHSGSDYCASVFWGQATVDGADAFVVTYHHLPSYSPVDSDDWNTLQIILVDRGDGDFETWFNYDQFVNDHEGYSASDYETAPGDCGTGDFVAVGYAYDGGDPGIDSDFYDFFGAPCVGGETPTELADLVDSGSSPIRAGSLNSTVEGRYILFMAGGVTFDDPGDVPWVAPEPDPDPEPEPEPEPDPEPEVEPDPEYDGAFGDIDGSVFSADIEWIAARGLVRGCNPPTNDLFCPDQSLTRGQFAAILKRALALPASSGDAFDDDSGSVFENDLNSGAAAGIFRGCNPPAGTMVCPEDVISRGELAAVLVRGFGLAASGEAPFADTAGTVFEGEIAALADLGVTRGCNPPANDRYCPEEPVTRGQAAAFIRRVMSLD
jgi:hypothetical protein